MEERKEEEEEHVRNEEEEEEEKEKALHRLTASAAFQHGEKPLKTTDEDAEKDKFLADIYYGDSAGAWRGPGALWEEVQRQLERRPELAAAGLSLERCRRFLASQPVYQLYKPARRNYPRNHITAFAAGEIVQIDIMDMQRFGSSNRHPYVLLAYDSYSKYLQGVPIMDRKPGSILAALEALIKEGPVGIATIYWDKEGSFLSKRIQSFLRQTGIHNYTTKSKVKAPGVERAIRTIRTAVQRYFEKSGTQHWESFLPKFIHAYNHRRHSTTKQRPIDVLFDPTLIIESPALQEEEQQSSFKKMKRGQLKRSQQPPPIGSLVRLNRLRSIFDKEASGTFTEECFRVVSHKLTGPIPMIRVEDLQGQPVHGALYPQEYQPVQI